MHKGHLLLIIWLRIGKDESYTHSSSSFCHAHMYNCFIHLDISGPFGWVGGTYFNNTRTWMKRSLFCKHSTRHFDDSFSMRNSLFLTMWETVVSQESFIIDVSGKRFLNKQSSCWTELTSRLDVHFNANRKRLLSFLNRYTLFCKNPCFLFSQSQDKTVSPK